MNKKYIFIQIDLESLQFLLLYTFLQKYLLKYPFYQIIHSRQNLKQLHKNMSDYSISDDQNHYDNYQQDQPYHNQYQVQSDHQNYEDDQQSYQIQYEVPHFDIHQQLINPYEQSDQQSFNNSPPNQMEDENENHFEDQQSQANHQDDEQSIVESDNPFQQQQNQSFSMESEPQPQPEPEPETQSQSQSSEYSSELIQLQEIHIDNLGDFMVNIIHSMQNVNRASGITQSQINQFPLLNWKQNSTSVQTDIQCTICIQGYKHNDELRLFPCMHRFHKNCIDQWLLTNSLCPNCRTDFKTN